MTVFHQWKVKTLPVMQTKRYVHIQECQWK